MNYDIFKQKSSGSCGGDGDDELNGGAGDDVIITGGGLDRVDGRDGIDTVGLESNDGDIVSVNLSRTWQYSGDGWNYIANVENVTTGGGEDIIQGNDVANVEVEAPVVAPERNDEPENVSLNFEDLLATLDNDNALVTSDDQVAFENAQEMLK